MILVDVNYGSFVGSINSVQLALEPTYQLLEGKILLSHNSWPNINQSTLNVENGKQRRSGNFLIFLLKGHLLDNVHNFSSFPFMSFPNKGFKLP
jgi:hypothetical protein